MIPKPQPEPFFKPNLKAVFSHARVKDGVNDVPILREVAVKCLLLFAQSFSWLGFRDTD